MIRTFLLSCVAATALFGGFRDFYCPECERFSADEWAIDARGLCRGCERRPVGVEATARRWYWCESHEEWRDDPCSYDRSRGCCSEWTATALVQAPAEATLDRLPFCPQCRVFRGFEPGADGRDRCAGCNKPPTTADAAQITWFWCRADRTWALEPCDMDRTGKCCVPRTTTVPVAWVVPTPWPTSFLAEGPGLLVSTDWLASHIDDLEVVVVHVEFDPGGLDAATRASFDEGHIPFAHPLEWRAVATARDGLPNEFPPAAEMADAFRRMGIDFNSRIVLYDTGSGLEAARAFVALEYLGLAGRVSILDGFWKKWLREGRDLSKVYSGVEPSAFVPKIQPGVLVDRRTVLDLVWTTMEPFPTAILLDARPTEEYIGLRLSKGLKKAGHIAGAMSLPWTSVIAGVDNPVFRSEEDLRGLFEAKGARPGRRVLVYCRSGVEAGHAYFAARRLGYEVSLYDGSYAEWANRPELPVESNWTMR